MSALLIALALLGAQETPRDWQRVPNPGDIIVEIDVASIRDEGGLRYVDSRRSAATSPRSFIMTFAIDCKAKTYAFSGETHLYVDGKLEKSEAVEPAARVQQPTSKVTEVINAVCAR